MKRKMSLSVRMYLAMLLLLTGQSALAEEYLYTQAFSDPEYGRYHIEVLHAAIRVTENDYGAVTLTPFPVPLPQNREIQTLRAGESDIMWCVTTDELESQLLPVRFPLLQGLGGHRVFVIHDNRQKDFPAQLSLARLKTMSSVQGTFWPDTQILKYNEFAVQGISWSSWFSSMYRLLEEDIVDYFPRNVVEVFRDLSYHENPKLTIEQNHLLVYPSYEYFFVNPNKPELQARLQEGLKRLLVSGELVEIFNRYPYHKQGWEMARDKKRRVHRLASNVLSYQLKHANWISHPEALISEIEGLSVAKL